MVEFRGIVLNETNAKQMSIAPVRNMDVNITLTSLKKQDKNLLVDFTYNVVYNPGIGTLSFKGIVAFTDSSAKIAHYTKEWKKTKMFPQEVMAPLMNLINVTASVNGVLVSRAINLAPPLVPPTLDVTVPKAKKTKK